MVRGYSSASYNAQVETSEEDVAPGAAQQGSQVQAVCCSRNHHSGMGCMQVLVMRAAHRSGPFVSGMSRTLEHCAALADLVPLKHSGI